MYSPLFVTLMGIGTVFFGLICIICLLYTSCPFHQMLLPRVIRDYDNLNQKA